VIAADWKERLLSEAPPKWAALEQYYAKMEMSCRTILTETPKGLGGVPDVVYSDIRKNGEWMVSTQRRVGKNLDGKRTDDLSVNGVNSRYAFTLGKAAPDAESFILANFEPASDIARQKVHGRGERSFSAVFEVDTWDCVPLSKFIKAPSVTITDVRGLNRGGRVLVQLNFERQQEWINNLRVTVHGAVVLDPEHCWCVRECHAEFPDSMPASKTDNILEYGDDVDGFPILRREQHTVTYRDGKGRLVTTTEFDKLVHRDIPESEFSLSAFGLPEVQVPGDQKPRTLWRWLIGIGAALGVLAILFRAYAKRRGRTPQPT
jgi:hypothetical protein